MHHAIAVACVGVLSLSTGAHAAQVYEATLSGTFTSISLNGADPGPFSNLDPGDTYAFTVRADPTPHVNNPADSWFDILSISLTINDGVGTIDVTPAGGGLLALSVADDYAVFSLSRGIDMAPFNSSARFALVDNDGDPALTSHDLPLTLDLDAFADQRDFALFGQIGDGAGASLPEAFATIDTFSAHMVPTPGAALLVLAGMPLAVRRRGA